MTSAGDRLRFCLANLAGKLVQVQTVQGVVYEGIFHTVDLTAQGDNSLSVVLKKAYKKEAETKTPATPFSGTRERPCKDTVIQELLIEGGDVAQMVAVGVDLGFKAPPPDGTDGFTDTGISGGHGQIQERKLQAWAPEPGDTFDMSLESGSRRGKGGTFWSPEEMFEKNRRDHDYVSAWDENEYTTKIDKSDPQYRAKMARAKQLADEIIRGQGVSKSDNPHLLHDRGIEINLDNEEALFGSVARNDNPNSYKPPHLRGRGESPSKGSGRSKPEPAAAGAPSKPPGLTKQGNRQYGKGLAVSEERELAGSPAVPADDPEEVKKSLKNFAADFRLSTSPPGPGESPVAEPVAKPAQKLNPAAKEFKMNPNASSFTPGGGGGFTPGGSKPAAVAVAVAVPQMQMQQAMMMSAGYTPQQQQQLAMMQQQQRLAMMQQGYAQQSYVVQSPRPGMVQGYAMQAGVAQRYAVPSMGHAMVGQQMAFTPQQQQQMAQVMAAQQQAMAAAHAQQQQAQAAGAKMSPSLGEKAPAPPS